VLEALAKDPDDRPATARDLWTRLEDALPDGDRTATLALVGSAAADETVAINTGGRGADTAAFDGAAFDAPPPTPRPTPLPPTVAGGDGESDAADGGRDDRSSVFGAIAVLVGVLAATLLLVGVVSGGDGSDPAVGTTPTEADAFAPVIAAGDAMKAALEAAVTDGWLPDDSASGFHRATNSAVEAFVTGDTAAAMGHLGELRAGVEALSREDVISGQQALDLLEPLAELEEQMRALRPLEIEEVLEENADEPPSQPTDAVDDDDAEGERGKGKGNGKGKDEDDD
jgi:hypothetical protein